MSEMSKRVIKFSPPDITDKEIELVVEALRSGWITTGPKTKQFEKEIANYCHTNKAVCLNSATAALELTLRALGIGPGDEVITSAYTYTASASVIEHVGAKIVLVDVKKDTLEMDYEQMANAITEKTKAIIPVDIAGIMCDYDEIYQKIETKKHLYHPRNAIQNCFDRVIIVADAAHSFGATYKGKYSGEVADFTCFSFHAVKNLTTGEGGAVTWKTHLGMDNDQLYKEYQLLSLHGQNKDALAKTQLGSWEYDIVYPAYKCNMTDIMAGIGLAQIERYHELLNRRRTIIEKYNAAFQNYPVQILNHYHDDTNGSGHLYILRILGKTDSERREIIAKMAEKGIACNVHYKPLPMMTAYKNLGFDITHYPNAFDFYQNEITLPLHTLLTDDDVDYIIASLIEMIK
jgi:UDP-bacillosamine synthetase